MIRHSHLSGYWNVDLKDFIAADIELRAVSDIVSYTETTKDAVVAYLHGLRDWKFSAALSNNTGECAIGWRRDKFAFIKTRTVKLTEMTVRTDTGALRPPVVLRLVYLRLKATGRKVIIGVVHMVSSVETWMREHHVNDIDMRVSDHRSNVWLDCARSLRKVIKVLVRWNPNALIRIGGDWNLDHHRLWVRQLTYQIGLQVNTSTFHVGGTLGDRLIDIFRDRNCKVTGTKIHHRFDGFDHKGWTQVIAA